MRWYLKQVGRDVHKSIQGDDKINVDNWIMGGTILTTTCIKSIWSSIFFVIREFNYHMRYYFYIFFCRKENKVEPIWHIRHDDKVEKGWLKILWVLSF